MTMDDRLGRNPLKGALGDALRERQRADRGARDEREPIPREPRSRSLRRGPLPRAGRSRGP